MEKNHLKHDILGTIVKDMAASKLESLILNHNKVGPRGARILLEALRSSHWLKRLEIADNNIGREGALFISELLTECRGI